MQNVPVSSRKGNDVSDNAKKTKIHRMAEKTKAARPFRSGALAG
jgi:hypothetical protein